MRSRILKSCAVVFFSICILSQGSIFAAENLYLPTKAYPGMLVNIGGKIPPVNNVKITNSDGTATETVSASYDNETLNFEIPQQWTEGIYKVEAGSSAFYLNMPAIRWVNSCEGANYATPGEKFYVCGENLVSDTGDTKAYIKNISMKSEVQLEWTLNATKEYGNGLVEFEIPNEAPYGYYELKICKGEGGDYGWSEPFYMTVKEKTNYGEGIFNVTDYGAKADDEIDDTYAIRHALAAAGE